MTDQETDELVEAKTYDVEIFIQSWAGDRAVPEDEATIVIVRHVVIGGETFSVLGLRDAHEVGEIILEMSPFTVVWLEGNVLQINSAVEALAITADDWAEDTTDERLGILAKSVKISKYEEPDANEFVDPHDHTA